MNIHNKAWYMQHKDIREQWRQTFDCEAMKNSYGVQVARYKLQGEGFRSLSLSLSVSEPLSLSLSQLSYRLLFPG